MGTETIPTRSAGQVIADTFFNTLKSVLAGNFVPRNTSGVPEDSAGSLGTSTYPWLKLFLGASASGLSIEESSGTLIFKIATVTKAVIASTGLDGAYLKALSVDSASIAASAVTTAKIADSNVTTAKIADSNVTTAKINDSAVTTAKINDGAVTQAKRAALGQQISSGCGAFSTAVNSSYTDVTNLSVSITTTGRPVFIGLIAEDGTNTSSIETYNNGAAASTQAFFRFRRDSTDIAFHQLYHLGTAEDIRVPSTSLHHIDVPAAGTYTYKLSVKAVVDSTVYVTRCKLIAFEL